MDIARRHTDCQEMLAQEQTSFLDIIILLSADDAITARHA
jgi:hypothetical protein